MNLFVLSASVLLFSATIISAESLHEPQTYELDFSYEAVCDLPSHLLPFGNGDDERLTATVKVWNDEIGHARYEIIAKTGVNETVSGFFPTEDAVGIEFELMRRPYIETYHDCCLGTLRVILSLYAHKHDFVKQGELFQLECGDHMSMDQECDMHTLDHPPPLTLCDFEWMIVKESVATE
ncbi:uncharacterized protein L969DRAFT_18017 [Mixia osmundae IAM 14324]|uniref:Uncharacterized protein n=1 Tax=Mixia osmundae (strain CBS 9802 / IAM 14324 / JCM 22182 / KY 12970) TaxID=764103 RepID=G7E763_MIXOS|nr:uncharacterized protein L969DRAFT_18017 [Mixia osmundae IAM 14324]KEI38941.1 hypothetical protein L969DRAFT_18017 [Mixia osmundae IAM 14324]GAA98673.1 hypothetical protein E5Q_05361 [Mixia osmundae IAM 14324]